MLNVGAGQSIPNNLGEIAEKDAIAKHIIGNKDLGQCPDIDRILGIYSRFLLKARSHETSERSSDAFIHLMFALDLALGGKQESTKNTTRRAAAIFSGATGTSYESAVKELRSLFDARSKYVHEGKEVAEPKFDLLLQICGMVTECLLRTRLANYAEHERFITEYWYPRLDLVAAAMDIDADLGNEELYRQCGMQNKPAKVCQEVLH